MKKWCYACKDWHSLNGEICEDTMLQVENIPDQTASQEMKWFEHCCWDDVFIEVDGKSYSFTYRLIPHPSKDLPLDQVYKQDWYLEERDYWLELKKQSGMVKEITPNDLQQNWMWAQHYLLNQMEW